MSAATSTPTRRSPATELHRELGAQFETEAAWELPASYGDEPAERAALREGVAIADITPKGKVDIRGDIGPGLTMAADGLVATVSPRWAIVLTPPGGEDAMLPAIEGAAGAAAMVTDVTHLFAGFALCGPLLPDLLARTTAWNPATLEPGSATGASIVQIRSVLVRRELTVPVLEVYVATEFARYAWETLHGAVSRLDGRAVGWRALRAEGWS